MSRRRISYLFAFLIALVLPVAAHPEQSSVGTRAARLTYLQGTVSTDRIDGGSQPAQLNLPLLAGTRLSTSDDGQAEVEFEDGSVVRLTPNSSLSLDSLGVQAAAGGGVFTTEMSLLHGLAYLELRATPEFRYRLHVGGDVLSPVENTTVRVDFDQPPAIFAVLDGTARVERQGGGDGGDPVREVRVGESLSRDPGDGSRYAVTQEISQNTWDQWNEDRDAAEASQAASQTAVRENFAGARGYGWSDLDANGSWYDVPGQGQVWQPEDAVETSGFDPYGNGAWVWQPGAGYLWASGYSWGWTPYRCGSWGYYNGFGWGWSPVSGCGGLGWGFAGGGRPVNIARAPSWYHLGHVPIGRPGPVHPIIPARGVTAVGGGQGLGPAAGFGGERRIDGVAVKPVERAGNGYTPRGGPAGSALLRDFPVNGESHAPVLGVVSSRPAAVRDDSGWRAGGSSWSGAPPSAYRGPTTMPTYRQRTDGTPAYHGAPQTPRTYVPGGASRAYSPAGPNASRPYSPAPSAPRPYSPPPSAPRSYSPPPQASRPAPAASAPARSSPR